VTIQSLGTTTASVVTSPVSIRIRSIRHEVSFIHIPLFLVLIHSLDIITEHSILDMDTKTIFILIHILHQLIHISIRDRSTPEGEITSPSNEKIVSIIVIRSTFLYHFHKSLSLFLCIHLERRKLFIILEPNTITSSVHALSTAIC